MALDKFYGTSDRKLKEFMICVIKTELQLFLMALNHAFGNPVMVR
jgi:hypothetical protein